MLKKNDYSCIVFIGNDKPKKWTYVHNLQDFVAFLDKTHSTWTYLNVYDRRQGTYLKRFYKGNTIPRFLMFALVALSTFFFLTFNNTRSALFFARTFNTHLQSPPCSPLNDFNNTATIPTETKHKTQTTC